MSCIFHFIKPGLQTLVQDQGRLGCQAFGVPIGGAMDRSSARTANWLVGNEAGAPLFEITLLGPTIEIKGDCQIAISGADIPPMLNGKRVPLYETISVKSGAALSFGKIKSGCRAYLAVRGDLQVKKWLGSSSAFLQGNGSLTPDSILRKGSSIKIKTKAPIAKRLVDKNLQPVYPDSLRVRVLPGPEFEEFSAYSIAYFFSRGYRLTADSNRMGFRLDAHIIDFKPDREVISSGIVPGTIQVTNSGQPIILMADAQTAGGYFRLANVVTADRDKLAQLKPGDEVWFSLVRLEEL